MLKIFVALLIFGAVCSATLVEDSGKSTTAEAVPPMRVGLMQRYETRKRRQISALFGANAAATRLALQNQQIAQQNQQLALQNQQWQNRYSTSILSNWDSITGRKRTPYVPQDLPPIKW